MSAIRRTLVELTLKGIAELKRKKTRPKRQSIMQAGQRNAIAASISNIINNSKQAKASKKAKENKLDLEEAAEDAETPKSKGHLGGYGTIKSYSGISHYTAYTDYSKIWSHIGAFASKSAYQNPLERASLRSSMSESTGILVSMEVIDKAQKHFKYFVRGDIMGDIGYVPPFGSGIDSKDWEKYRLMTQMSVYMPLLKLMRSVA